MKRKQNEQMTEKELKDLIYPEGRQKDIYRKLSYPFVKLILPTGLSADAIQVFRLLFVLLGTGLFFTGNPWFFFLGAILFQMNILFDTFDGAIARYQGKASFKGEVQDLILDHVTSSILYFTAAAAMAYTSTNNIYYVYIGILTVVLAQCAAFLRAAYIEFDVPVVKSQKSNFLVGLAHQDNSRMLAFMLLAFSTLALIPITATDIVLTLLIKVFLAFVILKIIILTLHLWISSRKFPLSPWLITRYAVILASIALWFLEKTVGISSSLRTKLARSKKRSKIEAGILSKLS